jgi:alpha-beta hydrolase superfamily lysophospholipase
LEDDLSDFIGLIRSMNPNAAVILGGHSSGGGLAIRFAGGSYKGTADGYLLLAPYLGYNAPTIRPQLSGWATPKRSRIVALNFLNALGILSLNSIRTLEFNLPPRYRTGDETLAYSYRLMTGFNPRNHAADLQALEKPILVLVGTDDETFYAEEFRNVFKAFSPQAQVESIPDLTHFGLVLGEVVPRLVVQWLKRSLL